MSLWEIADVEHPPNVPLDFSIDVKELTDKYLEEVEYPKKKKTMKKYNLRLEKNKRLTQHKGI